MKDFSQLNPGDPTIVDIGGFNYRLVAGKVVRKTKSLIFVNYNGRESVFKMDGSKHPRTKGYDQGPSLIKITEEHSNRLKCCELIRSIRSVGDFDIILGIENLNKLNSDYLEKILILLKAIKVCSTQGKPNEKS